MIKSALLLILFLVFISCGKAIKNSQESDSDTRELPGLGTSEITLEVSYNPKAESFKEVMYPVSSRAWARIPQKMKIIDGRPLVISAKINFNKELIYNEYNSAFFCSYSAVRLSSGPDEDNPDGYSHYFKGCFEDVDNDGVLDELNYLPGDQVAVDVDKYITLYITSDKSVNNLSVSSEIDLELH